MAGRGLLMKNNNEKNKNEKNKLNTNSKETKHIIKAHKINTSAQMDGVSKKNTSKKHNKPIENDKKNVIDDDRKNEHNKKNVNSKANKNNRKIRYIKTHKINTHTSAPIHKPAKANLISYDRRSFNEHPKDDIKKYDIKTNKNDESKKFKRILSLLLFVIFSGFLMFSLLVFQHRRNNISMEKMIKELGVVRILKGEKEGIKYNLNFPYFQFNELDKVIYDELQKEISSYISQKKETNVDVAFMKSDYNTYGFNDNHGVSVDLRFLQKDKEEKKHFVKTFIFCYGKLLTVKNIFKEDKIKNIVSAIKNEIRSNQKYFKAIKRNNIDLDKKLPNDIKTIEKFIIKEDSIEFLYNAGEILPEKFGIIGIEIDNSALKEVFSNAYFRINPKEGKIKGEDLEKSKKPLIALTFDDGPLEATTNDILDTLEKYDVKSTFFVIGKNAEKHPEIIKREFSSGHEIANHTYSHPVLTHLGEKAIRSQIEKTNNIVKEIIGVTPKLVRAPTGSVNKLVKKTVNSPLIYWTVDTRDWQTKNAKQTIKNVLNQAVDGSIILMHDVQPSTVEAIKTIIPELQERGFSLVTVSDMFRLKNISLEKGVQYISAVKEEED